MFHVFLVSNPFPFSDIDSDMVAHIESLPSLASANERGVAPSRTRRCSQDLLYEIFFRSHHTGVHTSVFSSSFSELQAVMALHGLQCYGLDHRNSKLMYLSHIVTGSCHEFRHHLPRAAASNDRTGCHVISQGFLDGNSLRKYILQILTIANVNMITTDNLLLVSSSLGVMLNENRSSHLRRRLQASLLSLLHQPNDYGPHTTVAYNGFERMSRAELLSIIDGHSISIKPTERSILTKDNLKNKIMLHLSHGTCTSLNLETETDEEHDLNDELHQHIRTLQHLRKRLPTRPLKRLLQVLSIPCADNSNLAGARHTLSRHIRSLKRRSHSARMARDQLSEREAQDNRDQWPQKIKLCSSPIVRTSMNMNRESEDSVLNASPT